jgi:hypothetical protein
LLGNIKKCSFKHREHLRIFEEKAPAYSRRSEEVKTGALYLNIEIPVGGYTPLWPNL